VPEGDISSSIKQTSQLSGGLILSTLNHQSTNLPSILPAVKQGGFQSDARLLKNSNPHQPNVSFSP